MKELQRAQRVEAIHQDAQMQLAAVLSGDERVKLKEALPQPVRPGGGGRSGGDAAM